jgi:hypothetical protein
MIDDVDELLALRAGDKYRLNDIRRRLEIYKRLYISDLEFIRNLSKTHLDKDLSPEPRRPKPGESQAEPESAQESPAVPKPRQVQTTTGNKSRQQELEEYEKQYLNKSGIKAGVEGFTITEDGEVGEITKKKALKPRKAAKKTTKKAGKTRKSTKEKKSKSFSCVTCGAKIAVDDMFCTNCGSKR